MDLYFPRTRTASAEAQIYAIRAVGMQSAVEHLVGSVRQGSHFKAVVKAGSRFVARDATSQRELLNVTCGYEAAQHYDLLPSSVELQLTLAPSTPASEGALIYWTWDDEMGIGQEHFHGELTSPGETMKVASAPGETWTVRRSGELSEKIMEFTLSDTPTQRRMIVLPPRLRR